MPDKPMTVAELDETDRWLNTGPGLTTVFVRKLLAEIRRQNSEAEAYELAIELTQPAISLLHKQLSGVEAERDAVISLCVQTIHVGPTRLYRAHTSTFLGDFRTEAEAFEAVRRRAAFLAGVRKTEGATETTS